MKTYKVYATMRTFLMTEVDASSEEEAWEIANELDGALFKEVPYTGGWDITEVFLKDTKKD